MQKELFVANVDWSTTEDELHQLFAQFGDVVSARIPVDKQTGRKRGFAFVEMNTVEAGQQAIDALNNWEHRGRSLVVKFAEPRQPRPQGGFGQRPRYFDGNHQQQERRY